MGDEDVIIDPDLPFVDAHHHLWAHTPEGPRRLTGRTRYLVDDMVADAAGHNLTASVYVEAHGSYRATGPAPMRVIGETEFALGQNAIARSGDFGPARIAEAIVGTADFTLGDAVRPVLEGHVAAGNGRFRGVRVAGVWDADPSVVAWLIDLPPGLYASAPFHAAFAHLQALGLSFDAFVLSPQIPEVTALARAFPDLRIVLDHLGNPLGTGSYKNRMEELFPRWRRDMQDLATAPNVYVKLGGLGTFLSAFPSFRADPPAPSARLAEEWRPYVETAIELFGAGRCMFESNHPIDAGIGNYRTVVNAQKRIVASYTHGEKEALFAGSAASFYRIDL